MGYYIQTTGNKNKANWLIDNAQAKLELGKFNPTKERVGICVVDNGPFEAAAIAYSNDEAQAFDDISDYRPKIWVSITIAKAIELCPSVKSLLT